MRQLVRSLGKNALENVSLAYIFLPCFLFAAGWLTPIYSIPVCLALAVGVYKAVRSFDESNDCEDPGSGERPIRSEAASYRPAADKALVFNYLLIAALVTFVVLYSGIGGYGHQVLDYARKHNSFLRDLMDYSWPLGYAKCGPRNEAAPLVAYIAFYLPSALVGKLLGWNAANLFSLIWAIVGVYLIVLWGLRIIGKVSLSYALIFLFFGGLDIVGWIVLTRSFYPIQRHPTMDFWVGYGAEADPAAKAVLNGVKWFYQSNMAFLYQSCHHVLPGSIILLMIVHAAMRRRSVANMGFLWAAAPLGSVFVAIGTVPFLLVSLVEARGRKLFSFQNMVAAPVFLLVLGFFYLSNRAEYPHGWLWEFQDLRLSWLLLFLFYLVEFGAYVVACPRHLSEEGTRPPRIWWWTAIACLVALPFYRLGKYSDLTAKAALPALMIFQVYLAATIRNAKTPVEKDSVRFLVALLLIGSCTSISEMSRSLVDRLRPVPPPYETIKHVNELPGQDVAAQLFGSPDAFFWKHLAKPVVYQDGPPRPATPPAPPPPTPEDQGIP